jgi:periplasmic protein TonB
MDLASLIHEEDYPASALANREEGRAAFTLNVLDNGRVGGCVITRSTGSSALDHATCAIMVRRARFTPARDSNGNPAADTVSGSLEWRLPEGDKDSR